jgi:uncharacterized protein (DUF2235 family)
MFRLKPWKPDQTYMKNRYSLTNNAEPQDSLQVWFAGVHADIGGGYPEKESGISKYPLIWMINEAVAHGLAVNRQTVNHLAWGYQRKSSPFSYVPPSLDCPPHNSLTLPWWPLEYWPKRDKYKEWKSRPSFLGRYIPDGEPRFIPDDAFIHESVIQRIDAVPEYRPINVPKNPRIFPTPSGPVKEAGAEAREEVASEEANGPED